MTDHIVGEALFIEGRWQIGCSCGWRSTSTGQDSLSRLELLGAKHEAQNGERRLGSDIRYDQFVRRMNRLMVGVVLWLFATGLLSIYILDQNSERAQDIQAQRRSLLRSNCESQNLRHDRTIAELARLVAAAPDLKAAKASQPGTIALIDALAPTQDCANYVRRNVK
jgi:hypothetical protein